MPSTTQTYRFLASSLLGESAVPSTTQTYRFLASSFLDESAAPRARPVFAPTVYWSSSGTANSTLPFTRTWTATTSGATASNRSYPGEWRLYERVAEPEPLTEEERAERERRYEDALQRDRARRRAAREADERAHAERQAAMVRARALLLEYLDDEQRAEYREQRSFRVNVGRRCYRIRRERVGNVDQLEDGQRRVSFCIHPPGNYPLEDQMLAQKMLLETDEERFLQIANRI